ncbi:MAG: hypothetical protein AAGA46_12855 [Cyanobacteria bacterium P01_F01_bin.13]
MPKKSKKHYSYGNTWKERTQRLLEALLQCANEELEELPRGLDCTWQNGQPKLVVRTRLKVLEHLSKQVHGDDGLTTDHIRPILNHYLPDYLGVLEDHREKPKGSADWHFSLRLESKDTAATMQWLEQRWDCNGSNNGRTLEAQTPAVTVAKTNGHRPLNQGAPFQAPPLPDHFVERPEQQQISKVRC